MRYFLIHKPYGTLSQFTREHPTHRVLGDHYAFPPDVYPVGRLDRDSEGLLLLTNDNRLKTQLLDPTAAHPRTYLVQVEGIPDEAALQHLRAGVAIRINKKQVRTRPAAAVLLPTPPPLPDRDPPIRVRQSIPDSWLTLTLTEGKNRQVRRMCAQVGYPVLRLVRSQIGNLSLFDYVPAVGQVCELTRSDLPALVAR